MFPSISLPCFFLNATQLPCHCFLLLLLFLLGTVSDALTFLLQEAYDVDLSESENSCMQRWNFFRCTLNNFKPLNVQVLHQQIRLLAEGNCHSISCSAQAEFCIRVLLISHSAVVLPQLSNVRAVCFLVCDT